MPMKTIEGYSKEKYTNTSVLLAGGGAKSLSDFIGSLSWDSTNKKIKYTPVGGSATDLVTLSWDNIANKPTSLPANGGNADTVDSQHFSYSNDSNSPTYLWATNNNGSSFLAARGSISVNYANSAGNADTIDGYHASSFSLTSHTHDYIPRYGMMNSAYACIPTYNGETGWHRIATIKGSTGYGSYILYLCGNWYYSSNTNAIIHIDTMSTTAQLTQVSGIVGYVNRIRLVNISDNEYYVDLHVNYTGANKPGTVYCYFLGNGTITPRTSSEKITDSVTASAEIDLVDGGRANSASSVVVNNSDSNSTYKMLWHSDNTLYSTAGIYCNPYTDYLYATSMNTSDWFRSSGSTGWYNESYGGGIYMSDSDYVRVYNDKRFYNSNSSQYAFYTPGGITVGSHLWGTSTASTWLAGQKEDRAVINVTNSTDANSFWPLIKWTSSSQGRWDTIGVLGNNLYFMSSLTSRTENAYDTAAYFDMTTSRLYSNGVYHTSYGSSAYALTSDGGVASIANMSVANAENIWLKDSSTNSDYRLSFGSYNSTYTTLNSSQYLTYNPYSGRLKFKGSKEHNSANHGGSISFGDGDFLYMKEAKDDMLLQHYKGLVSDTQPIAIGFVGSCPSNSSASLVYKKSQPSAITVTCTRVSSGRFKVGVSNISGKPIIAHLQVTPVRNYAQYEFAFAYIEDFTMDTADGGMEIASGSTGYFYVRTGRIHCQVTWAVGDYVATGDTGGFTGVVYAMINENLATMPSTSW